MGIFNILYLSYRRLDSSRPPPLFLSRNRFVCRLWLQIDLDQFLYRHDALHTYRVVSLFAVLLLPSLGDLFYAPTTQSGRIQ